VLLPPGRKNDAAPATLPARGATLRRGPGFTGFGARVAPLIGPFGNTAGLDQAKRATEHGY
jgi:hypothetical protein